MSTTTRNLDLNLRGRGNLPRVIRDVGDAGLDTAEDLEQLARRAGELEGEFNDAERAVRDLNRQYAQGEMETADYNRELRALERRLRDIRAAHNGVADAIERERAAAQRRARERSGEDTDFDSDDEPDEDDAAESGARAGASAANAFTEAFSSAVPGPVKAAMIGTLAAAGAAAAPFLAATISAGLLTAVGGGAIATGIMAAAKSPAVQSAGQMVGANLSQSISRGSRAFVGPVLDALEEVSSGGVRLLDQWFEAAGHLAPEIGGLVKGVVAFGQKAMPGITAAIDAARPVIRVLAEELPDIGMAISSMFSQIATDSDGAAMALRVIMDVAGATIISLGTALGILTREFERSVRMVAGIAELMDSVLPGSSGIVGQWTQDIVADLEAVKSAGVSTGDGLYHGFARTTVATGLAAAGIKSVDQAVRDLAGGAISVEESLIRLEESIDAATEAARKNGDGINANIPKQRANRQALLGIASAANAAAKDIRDYGGSEDEAARATERGRTAFLKAAAAMGVEAGAAVRLANKLFGIPNIKRSVTINKSAAQSAVSNFLAQYNRIRDKTIRIGAVFWTKGGDLHVKGGTILKSAGGPVHGPGTSTSDSIPARLSNDEHVWTAAEVRAAGGHRAVAAIRRAVLGGGPTAGARAGGGGGGGFDVETLYRALVRALQTVPIVQMTDAGRRAGVLGRAG